MEKGAQDKKYMLSFVYKFITYNTFNTLSYVRDYCINLMTNEKANNYIILPILILASRASIGVNKSEGNILSLCFSIRLPATQPA